jgi:hypothetical protein
MSDPSQLSFPPDKDGKLLLPMRCSIAASFYEAADVRQAVTEEMEKILYALALSGLDLRALDGITFAHDCSAVTSALQSMPGGQIASEMSERPGTVELARTAAVWRENELRFHIVLRAGLGLMTLSHEVSQRALAHACIAHEAAHVEHEGHLYRTFSGLYGGPLECGDRSRQTFLKAIDAWSEYAACRSSARFRPEAVEEFEGIFCRALEESLLVCKDRLTTDGRDQANSQVLTEIQQLFGDVFICAGYFLGHLDGLELNLEEHAPRVSALLRQHSQIETLVARLRCVLHELWFSEYDWKSIEVFAPIYDLIREMMTLHGLTFATTND